MGNCPNLALSRRRDSDDGSPKLLHDLAMMHWEKHILSLEITTKALQGSGRATVLDDQRLEESSKFGLRSRNSPVFTRVRIKAPACAPRLSCSDVLRPHLSVVIFMMLFGPIPVAYHLVLG